jgi:small subunit ribosomal protein S17
MTENTQITRRIIGQVVSDKMDKTRTIIITYFKKGPTGKKKKLTTKLLIDDQQSISKLNQWVEAESCRPISKRKAYRLLKVIEN